MDKRRILVVDDDRDLCDSLTVILENAGYTAAAATSRSEAMEKIRAERPDLVILDVMMETWHDGFEMSRELKADPQYSDMPILMLTSIEESTGIEFRSCAGDPTWLPVDRFLDKPLRPQVLLQEVAGLL
ncbi:MAG: response regulator [Sedimentisphaerales bacterium]|nr:response regulator [Sedimentisphaerales bacterium]